MIHRVIAQGQQKAEVTRMCRVLGVSRSGFYAAQRRWRQPAPVCATSVPLKSAFAASGGSYGSRRLRAALNAQGVAVGRHRVRTLMRRHGLRARWRCKFVHTTDSRHPLPVAENVLQRHFTPTGPDRAWVCDITYIHTHSGWLYLAAVLDLYARKVVGWAMAPTMPADLVCTALQMALTLRRPQPGSCIRIAAASTRARNTGRCSPGTGWSPA